MLFESILGKGVFLDSPPYLLILVVILVLPFLLFRFRRKFLALKYSSLAFKSSLPKQNIFIIELPLWIRLVVLALLVFALANPKAILKQSTEYKESLDIIIALDISSSMEVEDLTPNRLQVAKENIIEFIGKRTFDRLGLVIFGSEAFLQCPLTYDHNLLNQFVNNVDFLPNISDQTAIGSAISSAILALKNSQAKTKLIILLTDGDNNAGEISPALAAELAQKYDIKIYSIGIGKPGQSIVYKTVNDPVYGKTVYPFATVLNETELKKISSTTGGKYFNVQSIDKLRETYTQIDKLEKTQIEFEQYNIYEQKYFWFLQVALLLLVIEILLSESILRKFP